MESVHSQSSNHQLPAPLSHDGEIETGPWFDTIARDYEVVPAGLRRTSFGAMGTTVALLLPDDASELYTRVVRELFDVWERTLSRFQPDSELSRLNRQTGTPTVVSELLFSVLTTALDAAAATGGLYDPTLLPQMLYVGYDRTFGEMDADQPAPLASYPPVTAGWRDVALDAATRRVTLPHGVGLDFGGIAKGLAVDAALDTLRRQGISRALVNAGGDLAVIGLPPALDHWPIAIPGRDRQWVLALERGAVATSGIARRYWRQDGIERHHLLDPRSGLPAESGIWSVSVVASTCAQAEVAAKVAFILGAVRGVRFLEDHRLAGVLVARGGRWYPAGEWPPMVTLEPEEAV